MLEVEVPRITRFLEESLQLNETIRPMHDDDVSALQDLTEYAFEPIFESFEAILGPDLFAMVYPDWRALQRNLVATMYQDEKIDCRVATVEGVVAGLVTIKLKLDAKEGEIYFLVVHPDYQNRGIGSRLIDFALNYIKDAGMDIAVVGTGGDASHAPARKSYEKAGFTDLPLVRFYRKL